MAKLSKTQVRMATSVSIMAIKGELTFDDLNNLDAVRALANSTVKIGAIQSFSEASPRGTTPRYELDADTAGDMVERVPGLVDRTLRINRAVLYSADMLQAFGFNDIIDIIDQNIAFCVEKVERAPEGSNIPTKTTIYVGCWFHDLPKTYDIGADLKVLQDVEIGYTKKFQI